MSFLKKLFGGGDSGQAAKAPTVDAEDEYKGYLIRATLMREGSEYQIAGTIEKEIDGETKTYSFIRADKMSSKDDCAAMTIAKAKQIIDEQRGQIFD